MYRTTLQQSTAEYYFNNGKTTGKQAEYIQK